MNTIRFCDSCGVQLAPHNRINNRWKICFACYEGKAPVMIDMIDYHHGELEAVTIVDKNGNKREFAKSPAVHHFDRIAYLEEATSE